MSVPGLSLRPAIEPDVPDLLRLIRALAEYERLEREVLATSPDLRRALFGVPVHAQALVAEIEGKAIGFALWFYNFSTFTGKRGLYLEDVFVEPAHRGKGVGREIFRTLAQKALAEGCARFEWAVLNSNLPAATFYRNLGARPMSEWTTERLSGSALAELAA